MKQSNKVLSTDLREYTDYKGDNRLANQPSAIEVSGRHARGKHKQQTGIDPQGCVVKNTLTLLRAVTLLLYCTFK